MTKNEMISEVMSAVKWCPTTAETNTRRAMRKSLDYVTRVYDQFVSDKEHAHFYATLLAR